MTFSIVARSADGRSHGVAVASKFLAVGAAVPVAEADIGALATQSYANLAYRPQGLALLRTGVSAADVVAGLTAADPGRDQRQLGVVGATGDGATYTGSGCHDWAGGIAGGGYAHQGQHPGGQAGGGREGGGGGGGRPGRAAGPPAARRPRRRRPGRRRPAGPAERGTPGGRPGTGLRGYLGHRGRPAGGRPFRAGTGAGPSPRPARALLRQARPGDPARPDRPAGRRGTRHARRARPPQP